MGDTKGTVRKPMIKPKGGRCSVVNIHDSNRSISIYFIINNFLEIALRPINRGVKGSSIM
jgi:hypothetical protein